MTLPPPFRRAAAAAAAAAAVAVAVAAGCIAAGVRVSRDVGLMPAAMMVTARVSGVIRVHIVRPSLNADNDDDDGRYSMTMAAARKVESPDGQFGKVNAWACSLGYVSLDSPQTGSMLSVPYVGSYGVLTFL